MEMSNAQKIGSFVQSVMEQIEEDEPDATIGTMGIFLELQRPGDPDDEDDHGTTALRWRWSGAERHTQIGILQMMLHDSLEGP